MKDNLLYINQNPEEINSKLESAEATSDGPKLYSRREILELFTRGALGSLGVVALGGIPKFKGSGEEALLPVAEAAPETEDTPSPEVENHCRVFVRIWKNVIPPENSFDFGDTYLNNVRICVIDQNGEVCGDTGSKGQVMLQGLSPGNYTLKIGPLPWGETSERIINVRENGFLGCKVDYHIPFTPRETPTPTTETKTKTPTPTITETVTYTPTFTQTVIETVTPTPTGIETKTVTVTVTPTPTGETTETVTATITPTGERTVTRTVTFTPTQNTPDSPVKTPTAVPTPKKTPDYGIGADDELGEGKNGKNWSLGNFWAILAMAGAAGTAAIKKLGGNKRQKG